MAIGDNPKKKAGRNFCRPAIPRRGSFFGKLRRIVAAAHQWGAKHVGDAKAGAILGELVEFCGRHIGEHRRMFAAGAHVLADGDDVAVDGGQIGDDLADGGKIFAKPQHQAAFREDRMSRVVLDPAQQVEAALIIGLRPDLRIKGRHGLDIVVEDVGAGIQHRQQGGRIALEIGDQDFDGAMGMIAAQRPDDSGEMGGSFSASALWPSSVSEVIICGSFT